MGEGGRGAWPSHAAALREWAASLEALTLRAGSGDVEGGLVPEQAAAVDAWARGNSWLLPHHYAMYERFWRAAEGGVGGATRLVAVRPIVEVPLREAVPPLSAARLV